MKTLVASGDGAAAIVRLTDRGAEPGQAAGDEPDAILHEITRARDFARPLLEQQLLDTGEPALAHADGVAAVLQAIGASPSMQAAAYLVYAGDYLQRPEDIVKKAFGESYASLVSHTRKLVQIQRAARDAQVGASQRAEQTERVRKMLLAFSRDLRVVLLRLASRLQTLRHYAASRQPCPTALALEAQTVFAPLANRLGIWQIKWELEDLAFRFLQPDDYRHVAGLLDQKRAVREQAVERARRQLAATLASAGIVADVQGRPKHLHSIWKKMQGKRLDIEQVFDLRALRVIVAEVADCYAVLGRVHEVYRPVAGEFDDYIAKPKPNGYQSLHTVVLGDDGLPLEVQIRTQAMHQHAEHGVAAHWMYKEAGARGYAGVSANGELGERVAEARKAVMRQLLAWERDFADHEAATDGPTAAFDERIYVFTPQATIVDLPAGGTPIDFAYAVHTDLGHRCRGARVDGAMVPLSTALAHGQTVEIVATKEGAPSLDWLNPELGYLRSPRARSKVRAWFNLQAQTQTIARGRELVDKLLQREGRTALKLDHLAEQLGFRTADALFEVVGKDELSLRSIENLLRPAPPPASDGPDGLLLRPPRGAGGQGGDGVLVVGVESLLTTLARCCRPSPPDAIGGFVTRSSGVAVHRHDCSNLRHLVARFPGRAIEVAWGAPAGDTAAAYPVDVVIEAADRPGLLRDISELFARERMNLIGAKTQTVKDSHGGTAWMTFTVEVANATRLGPVLAQIRRVSGVRQARRK